MTEKSRKSKKQSDTKPAAEQPDSLIFYLERSLGSKKVFLALKAAGASVEWHADHFAHDEEDVVWLKVVGQKGWVVLLRDQRIRNNRLEREALISAGVRAFVLIAKDLTGDQMAEIFVKALPTIRRISLRFDAPFIAKVMKDSSVKIWDTSSDLIATLGRN